MLTALGIVKGIPTGTNNLVLCPLEQVLLSQIARTHIILTKLDQQLNTCPSPSLLKQRIELQTEYDRPP